ncbi:hypothetical protein [Aeromonas salmonicida]|uniref:hypothetical protein n=1 Tax=Aeromonas salmonicida TaxID=645 RepID=UPI001F239B50|nr:hypothetical protein [Aeromonas salmonicida]
MTGTAMPSASALAKLAGMMILAILSGDDALADADIMISNAAGNRQVIFNISTYPHHLPWLHIPTKQHSTPSKG